MTIRCPPVPPHLLPAAGGGLSPHLLRIEIGDVVRVVHATPDGRDVDVNAMIRGIEWSANARSFELELSLQTLNPDYVAR